MGGRWRRGNPVGHPRVPGRCAEKRHHDGLVGTQPTDQLLPRQRSTLHKVHWVRDWSFDEDRHQLRISGTARAMATLRNLAISLLRLAGATNITAALRWVARDPARALALVGA